MKNSLTALSLGLLLLLTACSGYQMGGKKPSALKEIKKIAVPLAHNRTLFPRAEARLTNLTVDNLSQDGTYQIATLDQSDALLKLTIEEIDYSQARSSLEDSLRSEELEMRVTVSWELIPNDLKRSPLDQGKTTGRSRLFAQENLQTAREGALIDALQRATLSIVSRLTDGY